jgi:hypothetical protein
MNMNVTTMHASFGRSRSRGGATSVRASYSTTRDARRALVSLVSEHAREVGKEVVQEARAYVPRINTSARSPEELFMSVPELESFESTELFQISRSRSKRVSIRRIEPHTVAETDVRSRGRNASKRITDAFASSQAFGAVADYIFGNNSSRSSSQSTTSMLSNSNSSPSASNEQLAMTTPVVTQQDANNTRMQFVLPKGRAEYPTPLRSDVRLKREPGKTVAALSFPGEANSREVERRRRQLFDAIYSDARLCLVDERYPDVMLLQYNPPFQLPIVRKNELCVCVHIRDRSE